MVSFMMLKVYCLVISLMDVCKQNRSNECTGERVLRFGATFVVSLCIIKRFIIID